MKKYEYILFDWDGCLAKTLGVWMDAYKLVFKDYGLYPTDQEIAHHFGDWNLPKYFGITQIDEFLAKVDKIVDSDLKKVSLYEGARELLESLKDKKKMALLTSSPRGIIEAALKHNKLTHYFEVVLTGDDVTNHKPHPEMLEKGLEKLNGIASEAIMIGDSRKDIEAAKNAKMDSILVYPKSHAIFYSEKELMSYSPTFKVSSLSEILPILSK